MIAPTGRLFDKKLPKIKNVYNDFQIWKNYTLRFGLLCGCYFKFFRKYSNHLTPPYSPNIGAKKTACLNLSILVSPSTWQLRICFVDEKRQAGRKKISKAWQGVLKYRVLQKGTQVKEKPNYAYIINRTKTFDSSPLVFLCITNLKQPTKAINWIIPQF